MDRPIDDEIETAQQRLRDLRITQAQRHRAENQPPAREVPLRYAGVNEEAYQPVGQYMDPVDTQIEAYKKRPITIREIPSKFSEIGNVTGDMREITTDFKDNKLVGQPGIMMEHMPNEDIITLGRAVFPQIASGFTRQGAASIFTLAYNLKSPENKYTEHLFTGVEEISSLSDKHYSDYSNKPMTGTGIYQEINGAGNDPLESAAYSYLAASMLRLFTKSHQNYVKAWNHIKQGFSKFYGDTLDFALPSPTEVAMKTLSDWFRINPRAKQSLYRILYLGNAESAHDGLKHFLYEIHVANTGMRLAGFFVALCKHLNCSSGTLLYSIKGYERQIKCLIKLLQIMTDKDPLHERRMWKYGRIFDETYMADLQTKACPFLVYILGEALKDLAPKTYGGIDNIAQLVDLSEVNKKKGKAMAQRLIFMVSVYNSTAPDQSDIFFGMM